MDALPRRLRHPPRERLVDDGHVLALRPRREEIAADIFHTRLDLALLLGVSRWRRVDLEPIEARELDVAAIEPGVLGRAEGATHDRRLEVVGHDGGRHAAEALEGRRVQREPRLRSLVEDDPRKLVPAVTEHHHENPCLPVRSGPRVEAVPDIPEVNLRHVPWLGLDPDGHVRRRDRGRLPKAPHEPLHRIVTPRKSLLFTLQMIVDSARLDAPRHHRRHDRLPPRDRGRLLGRQPPRRQRPERLDLRQRVDRPQEEPRP